MKFVVSALLVFLVMLQLQTEPVQSACCHPVENGRCRDRTKATPCCGYRKCNFFCCKCECRTRNRPKREEETSADTEEHQHEDPFVKYDKDGNGKISMTEAHWWLIGCGLGNVTVTDLSTNFTNMDSDHDGSLDRNEIGA